MWNNIFLPSTTSPPKDLRPKPSSLSRAIFGRCPRPLHLSFTGWNEWPKEKEGVAVCFICGSFVGAAQSSAAPTNSNVRGGWWVSRPYKSDPFVGAARITSRPCCFIYRGGWCLDSRARHCRGGSITSRLYKKFVQLLQTLFVVVVVA